MRLSENLLFSDPTDINHYFLCYGVNTYQRFPCPKGEQFNPELRDCLPASHQILKCPTGLCQNNAECVLQENGQSLCICLPGFTGQRCEININECEMLGGNRQCSIHSK